MQAHFGGPQQVSGGLAFACVYTGTGLGESSLGLSFSALPPSTPWACVGLMEHKCRLLALHGRALSSRPEVPHIRRPSTTFFLAHGPRFHLGPGTPGAAKAFSNRALSWETENFLINAKRDREQSWTRSLLPTPHSPTMLALFSSKSLSQHL